MKPLQLLPITLAFAAGAGWASCGGGRGSELSWAQDTTGGRIETGAVNVRRDTTGGRAPNEPLPVLAGGPSEQNTVQVVRRVSPSVVMVRRGEGLGSGLIVQSDGVILTNAHVVGDAATVEVGLADGRTLEGKVLGRDPTVDVAVVRIDARDLPTIPLADSDHLAVGQTAIAIGNPLGLERTVTEGVVSAINRSPRGFGLDGLIQTDAAISPGNSGGPLINSSGQAIGINTAVISAPGASGLGFAIPINLANDIARQVLTTGRITRAFLGIDYRDIGPELARQFRLPVDEGVIVATVGRGTPAAEAGLRPGDIITALDGQAVTQGADLRKAIRGRKPGDTIRLQVLRPDGRHTLTAKLTELTIQ
ncbi:MAG TPA: trypsin-like peptidase domain-containing protein [Gemmatimonadales bacterium]|jgi:serine protease Do|nr:trypsin-like peptidase domain-containing protein [Gemmatimonadales bacterium]